MTLARHQVARVPLLAAMATLAAVLAATNAGYGFHRDELYFAALPPAWGYVDQPPLVPALARVFSGPGSNVWLLRLPSIVFAVAALAVIVLITAEVGGDRRAQTLAAWAYISATFPLTFGHVLLTATVDLLLWPLLCLTVIKAALRHPRWLLATGLVLGVSTYNKLLIALLLVALLVGVAGLGPRELLRSKYLPLGALVAVVVAAPNIAYQLSNGLPQLTMGRALAGNNGGGVRAQLVPFLFLLLGPPLAVAWIAALVKLVRDPGWRRIRFLALAAPVLLAEALIGAGQVYYPLGLVSVLFALGCVPVAGWLRPGWTRRLAAGLIALNAAVSALIGLPVLSASTLAATPIPAMNQVAADQIGWPDYVAQIAKVYRVTGGANAAVITSNYGEYGAIVHYGGPLGLPRPCSGHNQLYFQGRPPLATTTVVLVGGQYPSLRPWFDRCSVAARLHNAAGVDNEEVGQPVALCRQPRLPWPSLWPKFQHYD